MAGRRIWHALLLLLVVGAFAISAVADDAYASDESDASDEEEAYETASGSDSDSEADSTSDKTDVVHVEGEDGEGILNEDLMYGPAPGIETVAVFPTNPDKVFPAGQLSSLIVGLRNGGSSDVVVKSIKGGIVYPIDFRVVVQNFTTQEISGIVPPGVQASFAFSFTPMRNLLPREFGLSTFITYTVDSEEFASPAFNATVEIAEPRGTISGEFVFLTFLATALVGVAGWWAFGQLKKLTAKRKRSSKKTETGTAAAPGAEDEWLQGTSLTQKQSRATSQSSRRGKK
eukprot:TRINITY_DN29797_c0_g1_i1.p1 TRINITY_DN29797_c0_g1~~TRINITY_DN29797_c0_g1_i1.p1  ORF type:complete len:287 (+),score=77.25 TRINITY_DN29797_c0_g1_i1:117-977(+)